jgi:hypothetical protein
VCQSAEAVAATLDRPPVPLSAPLTWLECAAAFQPVTHTTSTVGSPGALEGGPASVAGMVCVVCRVCVFVGVFGCGCVHVGEFGWCVLVVVCGCGCGCVVPWLAYVVPTALCWTTLPRRPVLCWSFCPLCAACLPMKSPFFLPLYRGLDLAAIFGVACVSVCTSGTPALPVDTPSAMASAPATAPAPAPAGPATTVSFCASAGSGAGDLVGTPIGQSTRQGTSINDGPPSAVLSPPSVIIAPLFRDVGYVSIGSSPAAWLFARSLPISGSTRLCGD